MAIENRVILNGQIQSLKVYRNEKKEIVQIGAGLLTVRRRDAAAGNEKDSIRTDTVSVVTKERKIIDYLLKNKVAEGDMLMAYGTFCTVRSNKSFVCPSCGKKNIFEGVTSYVRPLCVQLYALNPKHVETVTLTSYERHYPQEEIRELIRERKTYPGNVISIKDLGEKDGLYHIQVTVQQGASNSEVIDWLSNVDEISNHAWMIGNLCADPIYNPKENGGRICSYQLGINRKVYIPEDAPESKADFPWVKSLGDQADKDRVALAMGSQVYIDGSIQARDDFKMTKECEACGQECRVKGSAMEIVPYYVEYLRNCMVDELTEETEDRQEDIRYSAEEDE